MKFLSPTEKHSLAHRSRKKWLKRLRRKNGQVPEANIRYIPAPGKMSFTENPTETTQFLAAIREGALWVGKTRRTALRVDLSRIEHISIPAAVALAAELDHWRHCLGKRKLRPYRIRRWTPRVFGLLKNLGIFSILDTTEPRRSPSDTSNPVLLPFRTGRRTDSQAISDLIRELRETCHKAIPGTELYGAVTEAVANVAEHAYPAEKEDRFTDERWWATACHDELTDSLRIFVYDLGAGIPETLRRNTSFLDRIKGIPGLRSLLEVDGKLVIKALEVGRSSLSAPERGQGLAQMQQVVENTAEASLRIISGRADVIQFSDGRVETGRENYQISGTMIIWSLPANGSIIGEPA